MIRSFKESERALHIRLISYAPLCSAQTCDTFIPVVMCNDGGASHRALECASLGQNKSMCPCNKPSPPPPSPPPPPPSPGKGGKVGAGPLALMAGGGLVAVYCSVGILLHKKRGLDSTIPNASFWRGLPSLVRDGVGFFFWCCRRRAGLSVASAYNSYEEL